MLYWRNGGSELVGEEYFFVHSLTKRERNNKDHFRRLGFVLRVLEVHGGEAREPEEHRGVG